MTTPMEHKRHKLLSEVADHVTETGVDYGLTSEQAEQLGLAVADFLASHFGGQNFTFPRDYAYKLSLRDMQIYEEFRGNNWAELSTKYGITERGLRKLIHRVHKQVMAHRQPQLFSFGDNE
ncbi:DNA-binding protein [Klebsiella variicola]|uniref:Mor transcription activator family protein n=1 Tax=Klebsiella variicola TaxID=244366 RepID=UPI001FF58B5D|nr:Mor transcription activator family protein [Klebsiella variicola]MDI0348048.1 Mor transcription activator family protein [Raoultella ornithinolytica]MCJ8541422.1 DNA-binding protein [Klebsiella variicola]MDI0399263.1 Mor transcription activator family protein [Raoultella ornithinolytica]MDI0426083.1 Mor transcription activator family protein [Raoultella ornithinolytica]MDI0443203.1 Mor transcription activator family protein [Raoultella ornithinolytica]